MQKTATRGAKIATMLACAVTLAMPTQRMAFCKRPTPFPRIIPHHRANFKMVCKISPPNLHNRFAHGTPNTTPNAQKPSKNPTPARQNTTQTKQGTSLAKQNTTRRHEKRTKKSLGAFDVLSCRTDALLGYLLKRLLKISFMVELLETK